MCSVSFLTRARVSLGIHRPLLGLYVAVRNASFCSTGQALWCMHEAKGPLLPSTARFVFCVCVLSKTAAEFVAFKRRQPPRLDCSYYSKMVQQALLFVPC